MRCCGRWSRPSAPTVQSRATDLDPPLAGPARPAFPARPMSAAKAHRLRCWCSTGPTGAGKSDYALALAERLPVDLISVDSAQVFCGMDIGTAKPSLTVRARHPHQLVDIRDPAKATRR